MRSTTFREFCGMFIDTQNILSIISFDISFISLGKIYEVSDAAIKKWTKRYNLSFPPRGYWAKYHAGHLEECEVIKNKW